MSLEPSELVAPSPAVVPGPVPAVEDIRGQLLREALARFGCARLRVSGTSMLPSLWPGDVVQIVGADVRALRPDDFVLVERDALLYCHRFLGLVQGSGRPLVRTRGDFLSREDPPVCLEAILGRVDAIRPSARSPRWLALLAYRLARVWPRPLGWMIRWQSSGQASTPTPPV